MTGIIDYNAGNIKSVERALAFLGAQYVLSKNPADFSGVDRVIFPGDGEAKYAMEQLKELGFDSFLKDWAAAQKPILGICIGAQIVFDRSEEGDTECLSLIPGTIRHFSSVWKETHDGDIPLKVPHMGWNDVAFCNGGSRLCADIPDRSDFYFVHSYVMQPADKTVIKGTADYGIPVPSVVESGSITVCQFHPEKSGEPGLRILRNFLGKKGGASC